MCCVIFYLLSEVEEKMIRRIALVLRCASFFILLVCYCSKFFTSKSKVVGSGKNAGGNREKHTRACHDVGIFWNCIGHFGHIIGTLFGHCWESLGSLFLEEFQLICSTFMGSIQDPAGSPLRQLQII